MYKIKQNCLENRALCKTVIWEPDGERRQENNKNVH